VGNVIFTSTIFLVQWYFYFSLWKAFTIKGLFKVLEEERLDGVTDYDWKRMYQQAQAVIWLLSELVHFRI
jgi:hypothetical protein